MKNPTKGSTPELPFCGTVFGRSAAEREFRRICLLLAERIHLKIGVWIPYTIRGRWVNKIHPVWQRYADSNFNIEEVWASALSRRALRSNKNFESIVSETLSEVAEREYKEKKALKAASGEKGIPHHLKSKQVHAQGLSLFVNRLSVSLKRYIKRTFEPSQAAIALDKIEATLGVLISQEKYLIGSPIEELFLDRANNGLIPPEGVLWFSDESLKPVIDKWI